MNIKDDFLDQEKFNELQTLMMGYNFPWYYHYNTNSGNPS